MGVSLYTSRIVLDKLGVDNFGIYNVVGSVVTSFVFVKNTLLSATQRFLSFSKGEGKGNVSSIFSMSMNIQILIVILILILLETIGLWFMYNVVHIPDERVTAAHIVYQFSVFTFCISLLQIPYTSTIISNEKMSVYALISIIEVVLKLLVALALTYSKTIDKLILYGFFMMLVTIICTLITMIYCYIKLYKECIYKFKFNFEQFKDILSFSTWNMIGGLSSVASNEGPNYFMNYYVGVKLNAAMGIAKQVSGAVYGFSSNFQTAFNPQIVKSYASGDYDYLFNLIFRTSKLSFFLIYIIALPLTLCCKDVLAIWLTVVPEYAAVFCVCILLSELIMAISSPFWMTVYAIGNIRTYQFVMVLFNLSVIPVSWVVLYFKFEPYWILIYQILRNLLILVYRVSYITRKVNFPAVRYYREVVFRCVIVIPILTYPCLFFFSNEFSGLLKIVVVSIFAILLTCPLFLFLCFNTKERKFLLNFIVGKFNFIRN